MLNVLTIALAASVVTSPAPLRSYYVDARTLRAALEAPETPRRAGEGPRYCVVDDLKLSVRQGKVCRSRAEWIALGVRPVRS